MTSSSLVRLVEWGLVALVFAVVLLVSSATPSYAENLSWAGGTFEVTETPSLLASGPVPAGATGLNVIATNAEIISNSWCCSQYQINVSCQLIGGGTADLGTSSRQWDYFGGELGGDVNVSNCSSVTLNHWDHNIVGPPAIAKVTVSVIFSGSGLSAPNVGSEAGNSVFKNLPPDIYTVYSFDPVQTSTGNFTYSRTDVSIPGRGPTPAFVRSYNSVDDRDGPLGPGWGHNYQIRLRKPTGDTTGALMLIGPSGRQDQYSYDSSTGIYSPPEGVTTRLRRNADLTFTATHKDGSGWTFDNDGRLTAIRDRYGNQSTLTYDSNGRLTTVADPAGRGSLTLSYDTSGHLMHVTDWLTPTARTVDYSYDTNTPPRLKTVTDREGTTTTYNYDGTSARLTSITDANGHVAVTQTYDSQGRVATQKDARGLSTGQQTTFSYVTNGDSTKTTTVTYPATSYEPSYSPTVADTYDTSGRLIKRVSKPTSSSSDDVVVESTYDANGNLATSKDGRGNTSSFCYDVDEHGAAVIGSFRNLTRRIDPAPTSGGNVLVTLYAYDLKDNLTRTIPPKGVYSGTNVSCSTDLSSGLTLTYAITMAYDTTSTKLLSVTRSYTDPDSGAQTAKTTFEYDSAQPGLVSYVTPPRGNTGSSPDHSYGTSFAYYGSGSKAGLLQTVTDPLGNVTSFDYDVVGRRTSMVDPLGNASGGVAADHTWQYEYDNENRLRFARTPAPAPSGSRLVTESRYDDVGNFVTLIDANGQVTKYLYDERDSLKEVWESPSAWTNPSSTPSPKYVTAYQYDNMGNLTRVTRAQGDSTYERAVDYVYDGLNRVRSETQYPSWPSTSGPLVMQTTYDPNGNRTSVVDQLGRTTSYSYDRLNRLTSVDYSDSGTPDVTYTYDAHGQRLTMADGTGTTSYTYDEPGRLLSVTTPASPSNKTVGYRYDRDGNRTKLIYPNSDSVTYAFDKANRLTSLTDWASRVTGYDYFADGALKTQTNVNGTLATYSYDNARRLLDLWNKTSPTATDAITRHQFTLDAVGNRTQIVETLAPVSAGGAGGPPSGLPATHLDPGTASPPPGGLPATHIDPGTASTPPGGLPNRPGPSTGPTTQTLVYGYDALYRLTSASGGPTGSTTYSYDPLGNRLSRVRGSTTTRYTYDRADRITSAGAVSYTVDANGNLTARGSDSFTFDQRNRLKTASVALASASFGYDGDSTRINTTVGTTTTSYLYDVNRGLPRILEDGSRRYVWGLDLAYEIEGTTALVYHGDGLGSVRALTDTTKTIVQTYEDDEFGALITSNGSTAQPLGYTGELRDPAAGLLDLRSRFYDPAIGRFLSRDSYTGRARAPPSLNRFTYVENNPIVYVDPSGQMPAAPKSEVLSDCGEIYDAPGEDLQTTQEEDADRNDAGLELSPGSTAACDEIDTDATGPGGGTGTPRGGTYILRDPLTAQVVYVGQTNNLARRQQEHARDPIKGAYLFEVDRRSDDRAQRRGREQIIYDLNGSPRLNRNLPISPRNPRRDVYLQRGHELD